MFDNLEVGVTEGEPVPALISPKEALKAWVAAYKKVIGDTTKAAAVAEDTLAEPSEPIALDSDDENDSNDDAYTAFKDINDIKAIGVKDEGDSVLDLAI